MTVRAKFRCITKTENMDGGSVGLEPVTTGGAENDEFFKYTPAGSINMSILSPSALSEFSVGAEYYVDFSPAK